VNSANASRNCSSIPARAKFSRRFTASVADQPPSPLAGKRVVITRAEPQSAALAAALRAHGAVVVSLPLIQILPPADYAPLDSALRDLANFDWLIFTSQNAATVVAERLTVLGLADFSVISPNQESVIPSAASNLSSSASHATLGSPRIAAVGKATAEAAQSAGFNVTHVGEGGTAATLVHELAAELPGKRVLLPRSDRAAGELVPRLQRFGADVTEVIAYRTSDTTEVDAAGREAVAASRAILFFSPSAVHSFAALQKTSALNWLAENVVVGAIGPVTSVALRNAGFRCDFQASEPSVEEIVATLAVHFEKISVQSASGANS
jgi:uroporphyrinogen III methyltransferase/synthase